MSLEDLLPSKLNDFGWGPNLEEIPEKFSEIPYSPYTKEDNNPKICDWYHKKKAYPQRNQFNIKNIFFYKAAKDDKFKQGTRLNVPTIKSNKRNLRGIDNKSKLKLQERLTQEEEDRKSDRRWNKHNKAFITKAQKSKWNNMQAPRRPETREVSSFSIQSNWEKIESFEFVALNKESLTLQSDPETLKEEGRVYPIQKKMEKINTRTKINVNRRLDRTFTKKGTRDDPNIMNYAEEGAANVFAFDSVVSLLMSATRTVYSWDISVRKEKGKLYFDKREDNTTFHYLHVNETAKEVPNPKDLEGVNGKNKLSEEATTIDRQFILQSILPNPLPTNLEEFPFLNPSTDVAPCKYIYKVRDLGDDIKILIRSEVSAETDGEGGEKETVTIHTLNEFDSRVTKWNQKLDGQRGAVFATELLNNSSKISRWAAENYLADCSKLFLGFVSRNKERDSTSHSILGTQYYKTTDLFKQLGMKISQMWAVIKIIIVACMEQEDGDYIIIKEPNENKLSIYRINKKN
eukprot:TRINITY_DN2685_c0_g2_i1.p1 TRINITY_DN2685_c0_g2~~TRINITY_DN2685_c0_g2_i1.p1  ORF type:complete len:517 (+),score=189.79 TRINITY_DN2685_c0_g2_i1:43-1593(+)